MVCSFEEEFRGKDKRKMKERERFFYILLFFVINELILLFIVVSGISKNVKMNEKSPQSKQIFVKFIKLFWCTIYTHQIKIFNSVLKLTKI